MEILSVRERPELAGRAIAYFQERWAGERCCALVYDQCIRAMLQSDGVLPQWALLMDGERIAGGCGLIANDFISRMDLWPWLAALYVEPEDRGRGLGGRLAAWAEGEARRLGFEALYLSTDHVGYYERYGYQYVGMGCHPWGEQSRVYQKTLQ